MRCSLKKFIEENNIDVKEASEKTGVSISVINRVMRGTIPASAKTKTRFKEVYDLDIIEISHDVLKKKEKNEEISNMKQEIKELKQVHKADIKALTCQYEDEKTGLFNQIKELQKQVEIKDLRLSLTNILSQNDEFFSRPDVVRTIRRLTSLANETKDALELKEPADEVIEDEKLELDQIEEFVEETDETLEEDEESEEETDDEIENVNNGLDTDASEYVPDEYEYPEDVEIEEDAIYPEEYVPDEYPVEETPQEYDEEPEEFLDDSEVDDMDGYLG